VAPIALRTRLKRRAARAGVVLPDALATQLAAYFELLERWNRKINLTALDDPEAAVDRLLLEPVLAGRHLPGKGPLALMDAGSGGGSPAIPLTLAAGGRVQLTMVESKTRKCAFLREAVRQLGIEAIVENARFEELLARPELHESFDVLSVRAVRIESRTLTTLQAFLRPGGQMLLFRGPLGPDPVADIIPPLEWVTTVPLIDSLRSRLSILRKVATASYVPQLAG
jgi:16S rRNA (guanine527-N7)-methyltransferase